MAEAPKYHAFFDVDKTLVWGVRDKDGNEHESYLIPAWAKFLTEDQAIGRQLVEYGKGDEHRKATKAEIADRIVEIDQKLVRGELSGTQTADQTASLYLAIVAGMQYQELVERAVTFAKRRVELYDHAKPLLELVERHGYKRHLITGTWDEICEGMRLSGVLPHEVRLCQKAKTENGVVLPVHETNPNAEKGFAFDKYREGLDMTYSIGVGDSNMDLPWLQYVTSGFMIDRTGEKDAPDYPNVKFVVPSRVIRSVEHFLVDISHKKFVDSLPDKARRILKLKVHAPTDVTWEEIASIIEMFRKYEAEHGVDLARFLR